MKRKILTKNYMSGMVVLLFVEQQTPPDMLRIIKEFGQKHQKIEVEKTQCVIMTH